MRFTGIILAAGDGTRMKSAMSKVLHKAAGLPLIEWVMRALSSVGTEKTVVVCGKNLSEVSEMYPDVCCVEQAERLGSGHAVMCAREEIKDMEGYTLIVAGDMPLLRGDTVKAFTHTAAQGDYDLMLLTADMAGSDPTGYGRIVRAEDGNVLAIVEEKDATAEQKCITEVNISCYCIKNIVLLRCLDKIEPKNAQGEYYITDLVGIINAEGGKVGAYSKDVRWQGLGVNDRRDLSVVSGILRGLIIDEHMREGVTFINPHDTYIDADCSIGQDTVIHPGVTLEAGCEIGEGAMLYPGSRISASRIGAKTVVQNSVILDSVVGENCTVGPYAYLRPGTQVANNCRIGDFVETKNAKIGEGTKVSHLTYIGDAELGSKINVGCGVVFVNYDGKRKYKTTVGDNVFIGCNTNLISPVKVGDGAYIAAGSTITEDLPEDSFAIARARQTVKTGWKDKRED